MNIHELLIDIVFLAQRGQNAFDTGQIRTVDIEGREIKAKQQAIIDYVTSLEAELEALKAKDKQANLLDLLNQAMQKTKALQQQIIASVESYAPKFLADECFLLLADYDEQLPKRLAYIQYLKTLLKENNINFEELKDA